MRSIVVVVLLALGCSSSSSPTYAPHPCETPLVSHGQDDDCKAKSSLLPNAWVCGAKECCPAGGIHCLPLTSSNTEVVFCCKESG